MALQTEGLQPEQGGWTIQRAENLLAQATAFEQALGGEETMGRLQIGATLTIGNYLAVGMIAEFRRTVDPWQDMHTSNRVPGSMGEREAP